MTLKDINFSVAMYGTTPISQSTYEVGYTGDESSINVKFTVTDEADLAGATAKVHLYFADSSHIVRDLTLTGLVFNYTLVGTENDHAGVVRADIIITKGGAKYTRAGHKFRVDTSLEASAPLVEYVVDTLDTLVVGAEDWLLQAQTDFGTAQGTRAAEWVADNDTRADEFTAAQASRTTTFGASEADRTSTFNTNETGRSNTFTTNENAREAAAEANQAQAATNHSTAVADHSTAVADSTLASSDHGTAVTDHSTAVVDHSTASADHTASLADQAIVDGLQGQFDAVIANATVDSEVINARQGSATLSQNILSVKEQLEQTNVLSAEAVAKANAMASGSPKGVYATLALLQAAYPSGTTGAYLVTADGKWYYWSGSAWTIGGIYQATGLADGGVNNQKLSSDFSTFSGYKADARTANTGIMNVSITPVFDTNGLTLTVGDKLRVEYEVYTEDATLLNSSILTFANNDATPSVYTGGYSGAQTTKLTLAKSVLVKFDVLTPYLQNASYRYVKPFIYIETTDPAINHLVYIRNIRAYIGTVELPQINIALTFSNPTYSTLAQHTTPMPTQIPRYKDLPTQAPGTSRWIGKKANFLGDSVTAGVGVTLESDRFVNKVAAKLGLASFINYGQSGTRITEQGTGNSFVERYPAMSNDADLIVVFGITNDYWSGTGVFGLESSTTISEFYGALNTLITGLQNKYLGKEIVFILPYNQYWQTVTSDNPNAASGQNLEGYINATKKRCAYHGIPVLDLLTSSGMDAAHNANHRTTYIPDGVHPNIAGAQRIADRFCGFANSI